MHSFGAHFCEVAFDPEIARLRISRWLTVIDGGRMINMKTSRNQILGAIVMGVGMAMLEETIYADWLRFRGNQRRISRYRCARARIADTN